MRIHDGIFSWEGFGGVFQLAAGRCQLWIFDLSLGPDSNVALMKPYLVVVSDLPGKGSQNRKMSVRSCAGHVATQVTEKFHIDHHRMVYVEYYPPSVYGDRNQHTIPAKYEAADFVWHDGKALHPKWRPLEAPLQKILMELIG
jgi:hypothetical protein